MTELSEEERFWAKVDRRSPDECWPWLAFCNKQGYGMCRSRDERWMQRANRVAWRLHNGPIPVGMCVLHSCDNPGCVNPGHLRIGTNADNVADKVERGRSSFPQPNKRGDKHPLAKLSQSQVVEIRTLSTGARGEGRALAERFGVSRATICLILQGKRWRDVAHVAPFGVESAHMQREPAALPRSGS